MGSKTMQRTQAATTRTIVYAGLIAAAYAVTTIGLAPISFGPIQFRLAGLLVPLALVNPVYGLGLAVGLGLANLASPFGVYDYGLMPLALFIATQVGYRFRRYPLVILPVMAAWSAAAIAYFPLYLGGGIPWWPTAAFIFASLLVLYIGGYALLRRTPLWTSDAAAGGDSE